MSIMFNLLPLNNKPHCRWQGPWCDESSAEWTCNSAALEQVCSGLEESDGAFFISLEDFYEYWYRVELCKVCA